ncbi:hypothetical protein F511_31100 [Dorcoceras hygrometricum]|uniref:Uncharacterized protein n=1 Tax=Dorcoceras hygrometricum TaxID=472368 RepID=A0A2Z7C173_9LAMI|nr:hypothetical protein F511_31100 [Dorcoceras hygrometricum]
MMRHGRPAAAHDGDTNRAPCARREKQRRATNARPARNVSAIVTQKSGAKPAHHRAASNVQQIAKAASTGRASCAAIARQSRQRTRSCARGGGATACAAAPMPEPKFVVSILKNEGCLKEYLAGTCAWLQPELQERRLFTVGGGRSVNQAGNNFPANGGGGGEAYERRGRRS